jgi:hypothetical protein
VKVVKFSELCDFTAKQWEATEAADAHTYTLFGGARGPGKSYWLRWYLLRCLLIWAQQGHSADVMLGCEDYPSLKDRQINKISQEFPAWLGTLQASKEKGLGFHLHPSYGGGSILLRNLDDPSKYQSAEFAAIAIDELTKNPERTFHILRGSLRWPGIEDVRFLGATNPGMGWVRNYWIEGRLSDEMAGMEGAFTFVPGLADDNPHLSPGYWMMLDTLPGALRQAWRYGDWYAAVEGLVYSDFSQENVTDEEPDPEQAFEIAIDDGYVDPRAILFIQRTPTHILVFDEIYHSRRLEEESIADIKALCESAEWAHDREGWRLPELAAVSHEAVALRKRLRAANITARNWLADKGGAGKGSVRVEAIKLTRSLIKDGKGRRSLLIHRRCRNLIDEITSGYKYEEGRHGFDEKPADGNDHAAQALESWVWLRMRRS